MRVPVGSHGRTAPSSNLRRASCAALAIALGSLSPASSHAYCRTTTNQPDAGYNPVARGCWTAGIPVAWPAGDVSYELDSRASTQIDLPTFTAVAAQSFDTWNNVTCPDGSGPMVKIHQGDVADAALVSMDCGLVQCPASVHDGHHVITFRETYWPHTDPYNTLALTTVTYGVETGTIYDADIEINSFQHALSGTEPPAAGTYDLQSILTHEAGHFVGLAHSADTNAVMYAFYNAGSIQLTPDDVAGFCAIHPPAPAKNGCSCTLASRSGGAGAATWALGLAAVLFVRIRSRRTLRRPGE
jgi:hypothetical protein